jgi:HD superfamily phosphodiesterase
MTISEKEKGADLDIVFAAALLHDLVVYLCLLSR